MKIIQMVSQQFVQTDERWLSTIMIINKIIMNLKVSIINVW